MSTDDELKDAITERLLSGIEVRQIGDRRTQYIDPVKAYELAQKLAADNVDDDGPFLKMRFGE